MTASSDIKQRLQDNIKAAMRQQDKVKLITLRLISAAIKQREVDERITLDDSQVIAILDKLAKQRRESIQQFEQGQRDDLVAKEQAELVIIGEYLPAALSDAEIADIVNQAISESSASSMKDMGAVMAIIRPKLQGRADMSQVSQLVKQQLA